MSNQILSVMALGLLVKQALAIQPPLCPLSCYTATVTRTGTCFPLGPACDANIVCPMTVPQAVTSTIPGKNLACITTPTVTVSGACSRKTGCCDHPTPTVTVTEPDLKCTPPAVPIAQRDEAASCSSLATITAIGGAVCPMYKCAAPTKECSPGDSEYPVKALTPSPRTSGCTVTSTAVRTCTGCKTCTSPTAVATIPDPTITPWAPAPRSVSTAPGIVCTEIHTTTVNRFCPKVDIKCPEPTAVCAAGQDPGPHTIVHEATTVSPVRCTATVIPATTCTQGCQLCLTAAPTAKPIRRWTAPGCASIATITQAPVLPCPEVKIRCEAAPKTCPAGEHLTQNTVVRPGTTVVDSVACAVTVEAPRTCTNGCLQCKPTPTPRVGF